MKSNKPPVTRHGKTHTVTVGDHEFDITVNRDRHNRILEVFAKSTCGMQGHMDMVCRVASLGLQGRADVETLIRHMRGDKTEPRGIVGQPTSIYDGIAKVLEEESNAK